VKRIWKRALRRKASIVAGALLLLIVLVALFAPVVAHVDPNAQDLMVRLQGPGAVPGHPLGTDQLGRDVWARIVFGSRVSLEVGLAAASVAAVIGTVLGLVAGLYGGWLGNAIMRLADTQLAIPGILLALAMVAVLGPSLRNLVIVLGISGWVTYARVARAQALALREQDFVESARALGASNLRILFRYLLPNLWGSLIVVLTMQVATFIISEASLSFLGLGVPLSTPTWGGMLSDGQLFVATAWWVATFPGLAILITVLSINLLGDLLRDLLDPKMSNQ
jgi:peptide/nickel transport system permease protein